MPGYELKGQGKFDPKLDRPMFPAWPLGSWDRCCLYAGLRLEYAVKVSKHAQNMQAFGHESLEAPGVKMFPDYAVDVLSKFMPDNKGPVVGHCPCAVNH